VRGACLRGSALVVRAQRAGGSVRDWFETCLAILIGRWEGREKDEGSMERSEGAYLVVSTVRLRVSYI
jgi:hypothetical protein